MSETLASLVVKLSADIAEFENGMKAAEKTGSSVVSGLSSVGGALVMGALGVASAAVAGLSVALVDCFKGAQEAEGIQSKLAQTIANTGSVTGVTVDQVNGLADAFSKVTIYEDDTISAAGEVLSRFKEIGSKTMPDAMQATLDLATVMGTDAPQAALLLGKALADPTAGLAKLKTAGVVFTTAEEEQIKKMVAAGDAAGAQALILDKLKNSIGGAAEAAGATTAGKFAILENSFGNMKDTIGAALLPALSQLATMMSGALANPAVQTAVAGIAAAIGSFAMTVVTSIPTVLMWLQSVYDWFANNQGVIVGILAALGVAIGVFVYTTIAAIIPAVLTLIGSMAPVIAVMLLVAGVVRLLYMAWTSDFLGIQTFMTGLWTGTLQPLFATLVAWFQTTIPLALQVLSTYWSTVLLPAIMAVAGWIQTNVFPLFVQLGAWLQTAIPAALQVLSAYWSTVLLPAIKTVAGWIQTNVFPLFVQLGAWLKTAIPAALQTLSGFWTNVLLPAIQAVGTFFTGTLFPLFAAVAQFLTAVLGVALTAAAGFWQNVLLPAITAVWTFLSGTLSPVLTSLAQFLTAVLGVAVTAAAGFWQNVLQPALEAFATFVVQKVVPVIMEIAKWLGEKLGPIVTAVAGYVGGALTTSFSNIAGVIQKVTGFIQEMAAKLASIKLPDFLTPGSPTPFEMGLRGIGKAMDDVSRMSLPAFNSQLDIKDPTLQTQYGGSGQGGRTVVFNMQDTKLDEVQLTRALRREEALYG